MPTTVIRRTQSNRRSSPLFADFAKEFIGTYATPNNKPSEVESKRMILRVHLNPAFGNLRLDQIELAEIDAYKAKKLAAEVAQKTINNHLTVLRKMLAVAVEWKRLSTAPSFKWLKPPPPEFDFLTYDESNRLIASAEAQWRTMITVAARTGLRLGELLALSWIERRPRSRTPLRAARSGTRHRWYAQERPQS